MVRVDLTVGRVEIQKRVLIGEDFVLQCLVEADFLKMVPKELKRSRRIVQITGRNAPGLAGDNEVLDGLVRIANDGLA